MSGIAKVAHDRGIRVTGSDLKESRYTRTLLEAGVEVHVGHDAMNLGDPQVVVVSSAIPESNPELAAARERGLDVWPRAKMLAHLAEDRQTVAVAGTHGKTTTSAMIATMLAEMGEDPTFLVGGEVAAFGTNARCGEGPHYVVEADESDGSFMFLDPRVALITNIEADHLDHYGSLARMEETFSAFMDKVPDDGVLVVCADDLELLADAEGRGARLLTYGEAETADVRFEIDRAHGLGEQLHGLDPGWHLRGIGGRTRQAHGEQLGCCRRRGAGVGLGRRESCCCSTLVRRGAEALRPCGHGV